VLVFRIVRDTLITLLLPLFFAIFARPATLPLTAFVRNFPQEGGLISKGALAAWLLIALAWTTLGYGVSMLINRSDEQSDRNKRILNVLTLGLVVTLAAVISLRLRAGLGFDAFLDLTSHPFLRVFFFTASFASTAVMGVLTGDWVPATLGYLALIGVSASGLVLALTQVGYMYDQAAAKGFDASNMRSLQKSGDLYGVVAEQARRGKVRSSHLTRALGNLRMRGAAALLWKELLLQVRGTMWQYYIVVPFVTIMIVLPLWGVSRSGSLAVERSMMLVLMAFGVFILTLQTATSGFIELLKRVDFQKPLPFSSTVTILWEVVPKAVPSIVVALAGGIGATIVDPRIWDLALGSLFMAPSLAMLLSAVVLLVTVLFPDVDDATQRSFRGIMVMLGSVIACVPMMGLVTVLMLAGVNGLIIAIPAAAIGVCITVGLSAIAGHLYAGFNPSE
jgi:hypothetical protein